MGRKKQEASGLKDSVRKRRFKKIDPVKLEEYVNECPDAYLSEISEVFQRAIPSIHEALTKLDLTRNKVIAPLQYEGTMDSRLFEYWFANHLISELPTESIIVMDSAAFHRKKTWKTWHLQVVIGDCFCLHTLWLIPLDHPLYENLHYLR